MIKLPEVGMALFLFVVGAIPQPLLAGVQPTPSLVQVQAPARGLK